MVIPLSGIFRTLFRLSLALLVPLLARALTLNEIMYDPSGPENSDEFIELYNESHFAENLAGWQVSDGEGEDSLVAGEQGLWAAPGQYVLILDPDYFTDSSTTYDGLVPPGALVVTINNTTFGSRGLSNSAAETVSLIDPQGQVASTREYHIGNPAGYSDEKILPDGGDAATNWTSAMRLNGSPGARNSVTPPERDLAVTSLIADPPAPVPGAAYTVRLTVRNLGRTAASDSLILWDWLPQESGSADSMRLRAWSTGTVQPSDSVVIEHALTNDNPAPRYLVATLSGTDERPENDRRLLTVSAQSGAATFLINEIMFSPLSGQSEWIEILNGTPFFLSLAGWMFTDGAGLADTSERMLLPDVLIEPSGFAVLAADSNFLATELSPDVPVFIDESAFPALNNDGDSLILLDAAGTAAERVDYRGAWSGGQTGVSIERVLATAASSDPLNWAPSLDSRGGTPGRTNSRVLSADAADDQMLILSPNPFSPNDDGSKDVLTIQWHLDWADARIDLRIYDVRGREVVQLANNEAAGFSGMRLWDGRNGHGEIMPTGMYIVYLEASGKGGSRVRSARRVAALARPS